MSTRISTQQMFNYVYTGVANAKAKELVSSEKAATGKEITKPSQNPSGWMQAASLKDELLVNDTIGKNIEVTKGFLNISHTVLSQIQEGIQRAYELAISASGSINEKMTREQIFQEVNEIYNNLQGTLNTEFSGKFLFSGSKTNKIPFDSQGNFYGDASKFEIETARGSYTQMNLSGEQVVQGKEIENGINILHLLQELKTGLQNNNTEEIHKTLSLFPLANNQLSFLRAQVGSRIAQLEKNIETNSIKQIDYKTTIADIEEADFIKILSDLARDQTIFRSAVQSGQKILDQAVQFLK